MLGFWLRQRVSTCGEIYASLILFCSKSTMSSLNKFTFAFSSADELLVMS